MEYPEIDSRTKEDLIKQIKEYALSYTPELSLQEDKKDVAYALSCIYANMMEDTLLRFNRVTMKNQLAFFDRIGAKFLPSVPAKGYISFETVNEMVPGTPVKKGTRVIGKREEKDNTAIIYETCDDVYVTPARIDAIAMSSGELDEIYQIYNRDSETSKIEPFTIFSHREDNVQQHIFYIASSQIFHVQEDTVISLVFDQNNEVRKSSEQLSKLFTEDTITMEYATESGFMPFQKTVVEANRVDLYYKKGYESACEADLESYPNYWIRMTGKRMEVLKNFNFQEIRLQSVAKNLMPDHVYGNGMDLSIHNFYPFGERFTLLDEVYFGCEEALCRHGATISMNYELEFHEYPLETMTELANVEWKLIMKQSQFREEPEYDITMDEVIWEYFNGNGWSRLFTDQTYSDAFSKKNGERVQKLQLTFTCPQDMQSILVSSKETYYIRARIKKVSNAYKTRGKFITPFIRNMSFDYEYQDTFVCPDQLILKNNMETVTYTGKQIVNGTIEISPFQEIELKEHALYLGFRIAPENGPIRIFFQMKHMLEEELPRLQFEYYSNRGWKLLNVADETNNFQRTGLITFMGKDDFRKITIFGKELYYLRLKDLQGDYVQKRNMITYPGIQSICMNTTKILAVESKRPEYVSIRPNQENFSYQLLFDNIYECEVWVDEKGARSVKELKELERINEVEFEYSNSGEIIKAWVRWEEKENFTQSGPYDRNYQLDRIHGIVQFSDGVHGAIPPAGVQETIRIIYNCGGGDIGNLKENMITKLEESLGFISKVSNPMLTFGGTNQEVIDLAIARSKKAMKHGNRAVCTGDYEAMALEASREILKAKCYSSVNEFGVKELGCITLVLLHKEYEHSSQLFSSVKQEVFQYIKERMPIQLLEQNKFHIVEPRFIIYDISMTLIIQDYNKVFDVKKDVNMRLNEFMNPIVGNFDKQGFKIGELPNVNQISMAIKHMKDIIYVKELRIAAYVQEKNSFKEINLANKEDTIFAVVKPGTYTIEIEIK